MKSNELENKLYKIMGNDDFVIQYIFNEIERSECKGKNLSKEFFDKLKLRLLGNYMNGLKFLEEPAQIPYLKECITQFSKDYDFILEGYQKNFDIYPFKLLKLNIIAALEEELRTLDPIKLTNTLPKIKIKAEKVLLYATFKELANELFINASDHRLSQLISDNFIGEDGSPIDQKTCYNQLNSGLSNNTRENLQKILQIISKRLI